MKILRIVARKAGRRRAGVAHPDTAVDHPVEAFTAAQIKQLKADPMLVVQELETEDKKGDGKATNSTGQGSKAAGSPGSGQGKTGG